jgi:hypothetical protein
MRVQTRKVAMKSFRIPLKAVLYKEDDVWLAHCLEFDLIGDGASPAAAVKSLNKAIGAQIKASVKHKCLQNLFVSADPKFWEMFATGKNIATGELIFQKATSPVTIEAMETREYLGSDVADCESELVTA